MLCTKIVLNVKTKQKQQFVYTACSAGILSLQFSWTMNNLSSYCGLVDAKIRASDKNLPMPRIHSNGFSFFHWYFYETLNNLNRILEAIWPFNLLFNLKNQRILAEHDVSFDGLEFHAIVCLWQPPIKVPGTNALQYFAASFWLLGSEQWYSLQ